MNICSDFHLGRHFFGLVGGFFVGLSVTLWLGMTKTFSRNMQPIATALAS